MEYIICPWCGQRNPSDALSCQHCGGTLPNPGADPGPEPPPPPRPLPKGYRQRMLFKNSPLLLIGLIFSGVGLGSLCLFAVIGAATGMLLMVGIAGLIGLIFVLIGAPMAYAGWKGALDKIRPYENGVHALGEISEIFRDVSVTVNGRNPWAVTYLYTVDGQTLEGRVTTWKYAPKMLKTGYHVHVLYLPEDPQQSVIYPPLG